MKSKDNFKEQSPFDNNYIKDESRNQEEDYKELDDFMSKKSFDQFNSDYISGPVIQSLKN